MIGDSETDANAAKEAGIPIILLEDGYTEKNTTEIYHNHLVKDFVGIEKIYQNIFNIDYFFLTIKNNFVKLGVILILHK